jgi:hypothetical protein
MLPNNYSQLKQKISRLSNEADKQVFNITFVRNEQLLLLREIGRTNTVNVPFKEITTVDFDWQYMTQSTAQAIGYYPDGSHTAAAPQDDPPQVLYANWQIKLTGFKLQEVINIRHNFLYRFGTGDILSDFDFDFENDQIFFTNFMEVSSLTDSEVNEITLNYGVIFKNNSGMLYNERGFQIKLNLTIFNHKQYQ